MSLIQQGHVSRVISKFNFIDALGIRPIFNYNQPAIIFGLYDSDDWSLINKLKSCVTIMWAGGDVITLKQNPVMARDLTGDKFRHITPCNTNASDLKNLGLNCEIVPMFSDMVDYVLPVKKGSKIFSYLPPTAHRYYNKSMVDELKLGSQLLVGLGPKTGGPKQQQWIAGAATQHYSQCFLGLCLGLGAGGALGIVEMGLCGIKVVTNVIDAPNTIPWKTKQDVLDAIESEKQSIGTTDTSLANEVRCWMSTRNDFLVVSK